MATDPTTPSTNQTQPTPGPSGLDFMDQIGQQLLNQSGIISSSSSNIDNNIDRAISGVRRASEASRGVIESQFGREQGYMLDEAQKNVTSGRAAGSGGLMNMAALRDLTQTTDKNLNDLAQRKQELILQNDAAAASKISELELQAIQFKQQAQQQVFSNLLSISNFGIQMEQNKLAKSNQLFQQTQAKSAIALEYGLDLKEGDTLESVTARAMPFASKEQQLRMLKMQKEVSLINSQIADITQGKINTVNSDNLDAFAQAAILNPAVLGTIKNPSDLVKIINRMDSLNEKNTIADLDYKLGSNQFVSKAEAIKTYQDMASDGNLDPLYLPKIIDHINNNFKVKEEVKIPNGGLKGLSADMIGAFINTIGATAGFITGTPTPNRYDYRQNKIVPR